MAASDRILAVVVEAVAKLKKRLDVVESASPVAGIDGRDGVDGADASDAQVAAAAEKWLSENISQPADGKDAALDDIRNAVERYIAENPPRDGADADEEMMLQALSEKVDLFLNSIKSEMDKKREYGFIMMDKEAAKW